MHLPVVAVVASLIESRRHLVIGSKDKGLGFRDYLRGSKDKGFNLKDCLKGSKIKNLASGIA